MVKCPPATSDCVEVTPVDLVDLRYYEDACLQVVFGPSRIRRMRCDMQ